MSECPAERYAIRIWDDKDLNAVDDLFHKEAIIHSALGKFTGAESMKQVVRTWHVAFPDLKVENQQIFRRNDCVSIHWKAEGHQTGDFKGFKPTGKKVSYSGVTLYRIHNNKIVEYWAYLNLNQILDQLSR